LSLYQVNRYSPVVIAILLLLLSSCRPQSNEADLTGDEGGEPTSLIKPTPSESAGRADAFNELNRLDQAVDLMKLGNVEGALKLVQAELVANPKDKQALQLAMSIRGSQGDFLQAGALARQLAASDLENASEIFLAAFDMHLRAAAFELAEEDLRLAEQADPKSGQVQRRLAQFLNAQGRRHEASVHVMNLIRLRVIRPEELLSLVDQRGPFFLMSFEEYEKPEQKSLFELGRIRFRYAATRSDREADLQAIQDLADAFREVPAVWAFYGRLLVDLEKYDLMKDWLVRVPDGIQVFPEYWNAVGLWMAHQQRHREAIRAFAEALSHDLGDRESLRSMMSELLVLGDEEKATVVRKRLGDLDQLFRIAKEAKAEDQIWISKMLQEHSRPWESSAWYLFAAQASNQLNQVIPELDQRHASISNWEKSASASKIRQAKLNQLLGFSYTDWPLPDLSIIQNKPEMDVSSDYQRGIKMQDVAAERGLLTSFVSDFPLDGRPMFPHQANGGGIAAFDYDLDGNCDLYFVQSGGSPRKPLGSTANQLYRATGKGLFEDRSVPADVTDRGFGQGVCAGDVNQDGFLDLLVANIGRNAVYLNQGDGTFVLAEDWLHNQNAVWTSSLGLADFDGDRLPDLVEVNYIDDERVFDQSCTSNYLDCQPQAFRKCADVVYRLKETGGYEVWHGGFMSDVTPKLGFGVVIANFDRKHGNDFFISNDGDLNHYWISTPDSLDGIASFKLRESGTLLGCSIGHGGNSQACMGVAFGDFNRDGTLDLHVTNFLKEPVNLFTQTANGTFIDEAMRYRVADPSRDVLGFGTQAVDFDNDGWLDLAVLNGHVFDGRIDDLPFRMQPQVMRGSEQGFVLQSHQEVGDFWTRKSIGRTLAMLDWNRDGRMDLVANHLDRPVALLENQSEAKNWIQLELVGTTSERDAIGAEVSIIANGERWTGWQTGGDGLMATNEQILHFGVSESDLVETIEVRWPSGSTQVFEDLPVNNRYLVIENHEEIFSSNSSVMK